MKASMIALFLFSMVAPLYLTAQPPGWEQHVFTFKAPIVPSYAHRAWSSIQLAMEKTLKGNTRLALTLLKDAQSSVQTAQETAPDILKEIKNMKTISSSEKAKAYARINAALTLAKFANTTAKNMEKYLLSLQTAPTPYTYTKLKNTLPAARSDKQSHVHLM